MRSYKIENNHKELRIRATIRSYKIENNKESNKDGATK